MRFNLILLVLLFPLAVQATSNFDNVTVSGVAGIGTTSPNSKSVLDVSSTTLGFLPPRMTTTQRNAIASPTEGLEVYDSTLHAAFVYDGTSWLQKATVTGSETLTNKSATSAILTTPSTDIVTFSDQSTPSNPASGSIKVYSKSSGLYALNSSGSETSLVSLQAINSAAFTSNSTWVVPSNVTRVMVLGCGSGGGGAGGGGYTTGLGTAAAGGGSGGEGAACGLSEFAVVAAQSIAVTVGSGGSGGLGRSGSTSGNNGTDGGTTSVVYTGGATYTWVGGLKGTGGQSANLGGASFPGGASSRVGMMTGGHSGTGGGSASATAGTSSFQFNGGVSTIAGGASAGGVGGGGGAGWGAAGGAGGAVNAPAGAGNAGSAGSAGSGGGGGSGAGATGGASISGGNGNSGGNGKVTIFW